jgi:hypothetical protein
VGPEGCLELVLHIEQPYAGRRREQNDRQMNKQKRPDTDDPNQSGSDRRDGEIGSSC